MDYIYSKLNAKLADSDILQGLTWAAYETLPEPSSSYYMTCAVVSENNADNVYICIKKGNKYIWKLVCRGAVGQLDAPVVSLNDTLITWTESAGAVSYEVYANNLLLVSTTDTYFNIEYILTELGNYQIYVIARAAIGSELEDSSSSNIVNYEVYNKYFKFVDEIELTAIPSEAELGRIPVDFKVNGVVVNYK